MEGRTTETGFTMCGVSIMRMTRVEMLKAGDPHNKGITWEKFSEHRGYALPGYMPKHPNEGDVVPDGKILSIDGHALGKQKLSALMKQHKLTGPTHVVVLEREAAEALSQASIVPQQAEILAGPVQLTINLTRRTNPDGSYGGLGLGLGLGQGIQIDRVA